MQGTALSPLEYVSLAREYTVRARTVWPRVGLPSSYGRVEGKESGEILAYLWFDPCRTVWHIFDPDDAPDEAVGAFR